MWTSFPLGFIQGDFFFNIIYWRLLFLNILQSITEIDLFCAVQVAMFTKYANQDPWRKSMKNVNIAGILSDHNTFCDSVPAFLNHSFPICCFPFKSSSNEEEKKNNFKLESTSCCMFIVPMADCSWLALGSLHLVQNIRKNHKQIYCQFNTDNWSAVIFCTLLFYYFFNLY